MMLHTKFLDALKPDEAPQTALQKISESLGISGLLLFSLFSMHSVAGGNLGLGLMLIAILLSPTAWKRLAREPLFWLALLTIGYVLLRANLTSEPGPAPEKVLKKQAINWVTLFLYFIPAWWISRSSKRIPLVLSLMLAGFTLGSLSSLDAATLSQIQEGFRTGLHYGKPIIFGFDCAVALLAMTILTAYWINPANPMNKGRRILLLGLALIALLLYLQGLVISQSRGVWLSLLIALPVAILLLWWTNDRRHTRTRGALIALAAGTIMVLAALAINWGTINQRLTTERQAMTSVVTEGLDQAPLGSVTYRLHLWRFGIDKWLEKPLLGWGPGSTQAMIEAEDSVALKNPFDGNSFDHLHSAYFELLFQLGAIGFALVGLTAVLMTALCFKRFRSGAMSRYLLSFIISNFVLIAVYSLTDFRHLHWNWRYYWMILGGITLGLAMIQRPTSTDS